MALSMARVYPCAYMVPVFGFTLIRGFPRHALVLSLAIIPAGALHGQLDLTSLGLVSWATLIFKEVVLGVLLGLVLGLPFWLFESVGALLDNQRGALTGGQLNPALGADATPIGHMLKEMTIVVLMTTLGFEVLLQVLWSSYTAWPALTLMPLPADGYSGLLKLLDGTFNYLVLYSAPFVALLLLVELALALLSLYSPQLQVFVIAMPAKCLIGIAFFALYLPYLVEHMTNRLHSFSDLIPSVRALLDQPG
ncbi:type III secretion system export apparatus subunit SctT [Pseudomonas synxantha]